GNTGRNDAGLKLLKKAYNLDSGCDSCLYNAGTIYSNGHFFVEALKYYKKALAVKQSSRVYFHLGLTFSFIGEFPQALKTFDKAIRLDPGDKKLYFERAVCRMKMKMYDDAIMDLDQALDHSRPHAAWVYLRGVAKSRLAKYEEAISDF